MLLIIKVFGKLLAILPECLPRALSVLLGDLLFFCSGQRRHTMLLNFHHCFPQRSRQWQEATARQSCRRLVEMAFFVLASPHFSRQALRQRFQVDPTLQQRIKENAEAGHPAVLLVPHFSMMEAMTALPGLVDGPMQHCGAIYRPLKQQAIEAWVLQTRQRFGAELLSRKKGFIRAQQILREAGVVSVFFDQNAGRSGILTTCFGRVCSSTELPGLLAARFDGLIGFLYPEHTGFWRGTIRLEERSRPAQPEQVVFLANQWLEEKLSNDDNACADWLWLHDRWRHQDEPAKRFRLESRRNHLPQTMEYFGWPELPRTLRIWIRMPNWLGDVVMALPLIQAVRQGRPDAEITLLAQPHFLPLLEQLAIAEHLHALPPKDQPGYFKHCKQLRYGYPDVHILLTNSIRGDLEARAIRAPQRFGIERPGKRRRWLTHRWTLPDGLDEAQLHQTRLWEQFFQHFGLQEPLDLKPRKWKSTSPGVAIGLIPSTENEPAKRWPIAHWRALIEAHAKQPFVIFGTARDAAICAEVAAGFPPERVRNRAGQTGLLEFADALASCRAVVCNDTGGMHLANLLGVPVVVLYGPTNPLRTGPIYTGEVANLQPPDCPPTGGAPIASLRIENVSEVIKKYCIQA